MHGRDVLEIYSAAWADGGWIWYDIGSGCRVKQKYLCRRC